MALIFTFTMFASASGFDTKPILDISIEQAQDVSPPLNVVAMNYQEIVIVQSATEIANLELRIRLQNADYNYDLQPTALRWQNDKQFVDTSQFRLKTKKPNYKNPGDKHISQPLNRRSYNQLE